MTSKTTRHLGHWLLLAFFGITLAAYWPGLSGGWLFDDYPNIVDNHGVQPHTASISSLVRAALSSPSSEFKRPLASLSFAANYLVGGINPWGWKLCNVILHLLNGALIFVLTQLLLFATQERNTLHGGNLEQASHLRVGVTAALVAGGWMLLPINITAVLYVVQRMESMANLFVLLGMIGYVIGRRRMFLSPHTAATCRENEGWRGFWLCAASITVCTALGLLAKETAVMLPLYAFLTEWIVFRFAQHTTPVAPVRTDWRIVWLFMLVLLLPMLAGLAWLLPGLLHHSTWAIRDFTLRTRLLSEARIVVDYIVWTWLPSPHALSFYHDDFFISTGLLSPWTTLACIVILLVLFVFTLLLRKRQPLVALGLALFLGCNLLTGTIIPLELIFEHRNYFASYGLLLAGLPLLIPISSRQGVMPAFKLARSVLLGGLLLLWAGETAMTARAWGSPLDMAQSLANRAPRSPRAQYELGRLYIMYSQYNPDSPFTRLAYTPLERAASLPDSSILPEQALIFMNARMHLPIKDAWWDSLIAKLKAHKPGVQDESSLGTLTQCAHDHQCELQPQRMIDAFLAALSHPNPSARLLAAYGDYAWNVLNDRSLGLSMAMSATQADPAEPAYHITLLRMFAVLGRNNDARSELKKLESLNYGGRLNTQLNQLRSLPGLQ